MQWFQIEIVHSVKIPYFEGQVLVGQCRSRPSMKWMWALERETLCNAILQDGRNTDVLNDNPRIFQRIELWSIEELWCVISMGEEQFLLWQVKCWGILVRILGPPFFPICSTSVNFQQVFIDSYFQYYQFLDKLIPYFKFKTSILATKNPRPPPPLDTETGWDRNKFLFTTYHTNDWKLDTSSDLFNSRNFRPRLHGGFLLPTQYFKQAL